MAETYAQAAARLLWRMDERKKLVQFPQTQAGRLRLRHEMARHGEIAGRNFDEEARLLAMIERGYGEYA